MAKSQNEFDRRVRKLNKKHAALSNGHTAVMRQDGLIVVKPQRPPLRFPYKLVLGAGAMVILFKAATISSLGTEPYNDRVSNLANGTAAEKVGAMVMQIDPVSATLADWIKPYLTQSQTL